MNSVNRSCRTTKEITAAQSPLEPTCYQSFLSVYVAAHTFWTTVGMSDSLMIFVFKRSVMKSTLSFCARDCEYPPVLILDTNSLKKS